MRYYKITITDPSNPSAQPTVISSQVNGANDPGALNIELDITNTTFAVPMGASFIRLWGISLENVGQASNINFMNIDVEAGMFPGLPLASAQAASGQAGLLASGQIQQAFGNWMGTDQTLDILFTAAQPQNGSTTNISGTWPAGVPMVNMIQSTLRASFPNYTLKINISPNLVLPNDEPFFYGSITQFAQYVKEISQGIRISDGYLGVDIVISGTTFSVYDGTGTLNPKNIQFTDLIGQATWINNGQISLSCVMRADLQIGDAIKMPVGALLPGVATTSQNSLSQYRNKSVFQGNFQIDSARHTGNFRQKDGKSWISTFTAHPVSN